MSEIIPLRKNRSFNFWVSAQIVSPIAESFSTILITWTIWKESNSTTLLALTLILTTIPQIIFGMVAGVATDRFNRKKIVMFCNAIRAVLMVVMGLLAFSSLLNEIIFMLASFILGFLRLFAMTAYRAAMPGIVHKEQLMKANSITNSVRMGFWLIGPLFAGFSLTLLSTGQIMIMNAILFIISVFLLMPVQIKQVKVEHKNKNLFKDLGVGLKLVSQDRLIFSIFITFAAFTCFGRGIAHLGNLMVSNEIGLDSSGFGVLSSADGFGYLIAGIIMARLAIKNKYRTMMLAWLGGGIAFLFMPFSDSIWLPLILLFMVGITQPFVDVPLVTLVQQRVADEHLGKVFGFHTVTIWIGEFMAYALFGYLFGAFTPTMVYATSGFIVGLLAIGMLIFGRIRLNNANNNIHQPESMTKNISN
ncbi:Transmembrane secretion effector [Paenibacillus polysaccharolyticus]|uniref:Transmembrane secretion effector n=1 Tax=Paenibacillus polysaccharolyticus TaxID=582692 RepID=A0A1G5D451_9BACL|nr:MFS transporter [Paenibacillus polysaccharolyticus]SCY09406.1 Transmembrane secretion effector [Paenibacillus polysaccharolyticus]